MEVCESDGELVLIKPWIGAVTNIRMDHLEHYHQLFEEYHDAIVSFLFHAQRRVCSKGILAHIEPQSRNYAYDSVDRDIDLRIPGKYNLMNASCAMVCASLLDIPESRSRIHLHTYQNVDRRFSVRFESDSLSIVDDYAHTPDEIESVVEACREAYPARSVILAFEPHRYSRLEREGVKFEHMLDQLPTDKNLLLPIYSAYEPQKPHLYENFCKRVTQKNGRSQYCESADDLYDWLDTQDRSKGIVILFVGAGDSSRFAKEVAHQIQIRVVKEEKV
jgi:UDP-N-acetylmuramate--alanine ligase